MAKRRKRASTPHRRRRRKSMSEFPLSRRGGKRRTRRRKKGLSEMFTPATFKEGGMSALSGGLGGGISFVIDLLVPNDKPGLRAVAQGAGAIIMAGGFGLPKVGAGMAGAFVNNLANDLYDKAMSEMEDTNYAKNGFDKYPDALDENGTAMYLAEDGNFYYLEEFALAEDGQYYLAETMQANLYPGYVNPNM